MAEPAGKSDIIDVDTASDPAAASDPSPPRTRKPRVVAVVVLAGVVVMGGVIRWLLLHSPASVINADESYMRIETYEILRGQFPIVLGGTIYTLPLESYLYAPFTYLFGANVVPLKLVSTTLWLLTSMCLYAVGARVASRRAGLIAAAVCWMSPGALLILSITAYPAYASGMLTISVAFLLASTILEGVAPGRAALFAFGAVAGFGFWLHPMFLAVLVPMVVFVMLAVRRLDGWVSVIGGGLVGCLPFLLWNAVNSWPSLEGPVPVPGSYADRMRTFFVDLIPRAFGLRGSELDWYHDRLGPILYVALVAVVVVGVWSVQRNTTSRSRSLLLVVLLAVFPLMALFQNLIYANDGRYAMISFPFLAVAIGAGIDRLAGARPTVRAVGVMATCALIWFVGFVRPNAAPYLEHLGDDPNQELFDAVDVLDDEGITRVYGSYWAALPLDFAGDNRIVSGVFPFWPIRFPDRQRIVGATPPEDVAVVFTPADEDPTQLLMPVENYRRIEFSDRVMYLPSPQSAPTELAD